MKSSVINLLEQTIIFFCFYNCLTTIFYCWSGSFRCEEGNKQTHFLDLTPQHFIDFPNKIKIDSLWIESSFDDKITYSDFFVDLNKTEIKNQFNCYCFIPFDSPDRILWNAFEKTLTMEELKVIIALKRLFF